LTSRIADESGTAVEQLVRPPITTLVRY
jgi:hypothetical protein